MKTTKRGSSLKIPDEIRVMILRCCSLQTIFRFALTCKRNHCLVENSVPLQLRIELEANGLELVGKFSRRSSYRQILDELRRYRDAWLDLDILSPVARPVQEQDMKCWQLYEGHWALGFSHRKDKPDSLQTINLDSLTLPPTVDFRTEYDQFTVDPSQQLVVLLAASRKGLHVIHIHLRSLVTGGPHPLARLPTLTAILPEPIEAELSCNILRHRCGPQIMGKTLVINVDSPMQWTSCILVWDWTAGVLLGHMESTEGFFNTGFLDHHHLVSYDTFLFGPDCDEMSGDESSQGSTDNERPWEIFLHIYAIPEVCTYHHLPHGARFNVFDSDILCPKLFFRFPRLDSAFAIVPHRTLLRSGPTPDCVTYTSHSAQFASSGVPTLGLTLGLTRRKYFGTTFRTEGAHIHDLYYRIFIDTEHLLKYSPVEGRTQRIVRWGEQATRWFQEDPGSFDYRECWVGWTSGSRFVRGDLINQDAQALTVYDFNPLTVKRHLNRSRPYYTQVPQSRRDHAKNTRAIRQGEGLFIPKLSYGSHIDETPSVQPSNEVLVHIVRTDQPTVVSGGFQEPFQSRLPYRSVTKASSVYPSGGWFVDGSHIIAIHQWMNMPWEFYVYSLNVGDDVIDLSDDE